VPTVSRWLWQEGLERGWYNAMSIMLFRNPQEFRRTPLSRLARRTQGADWSFDTWWALDGEDDGKGSICPPTIEDIDDIVAAQEELIDLKAIPASWRYVLTPDQSLALDAFRRQRENRELSPQQLAALEAFESRREGLADTGPSRS